MASLTLELVANKPACQDKECLKPFSPQEIQKVRNFHTSMWGYYQPTALVALPHLAAWLGVKSVYVKDESTRFGLGAFKGLGGSYAMCSYLAARFDLPLIFDAIKNANIEGKAPGLTFATTTDGNHGRGIAWTAKILGVKAVIYMPKGADPARVNAIKSEGADVKVTNLNYDDAVRLLSKDAEAQGWIVVQDTAWPGYTELPLKIMQGYTTMAAEALEKMPQVPTHVFVQAGVGSVAAAVQAVLRNNYGPGSPIFTILEAAAADCFYRSFSTGSSQAVSGELNTIMAGLACGEANPLAWRILHEYSNFAISCHDEVSALGMRMLGNPLAGDTPVTAGESGAIGVGVLGLLNKYHNIKTDLGINKDSVLLLFNTEGATAPDSYREIVWGGKFPCNFGGWDNA